MGLSAEATRVLATSTATDRKLLTLTVLEDLTIREAAIVLEISEVAAKMPIWTANTQICNQWY